MRVSNIHSLRSLAAFLVVLFHVNLNAEKNGFHKSSLSNIFDLGNSGVDIFFVISGFVMIVSCWNKEISIIKFMFKRVKRILPLYLVLTSAYYAIALLFPSMIPNIKVSFPWFLSSITFTSGIFGYNAPILGQGWTLEFEMFFYLVFSISLLANKNKKKMGITSTIMLIAVAAGLPYLLLEFLLGMSAGYLYKTKKVSNSSGILIAIIGACSLFLNVFYEFSIFDRVFTYGVPSFFIVYGLSVMKQSEYSWLTKLGDSSYSLYLSQFFIIPIMFKLSSFFERPVSNSTFLIVLVSMTTLVFGHLVYLTVEKPLAIMLTKHARKKLGNIGGIV